MGRTNRSNRVKASAAVLGVGAVIAMGLIGLTSGGLSDGHAVVLGGSMETGETTTVTYSGTIAPVVAAPAVKATPFGEG